MRIEQRKIAGLTPVAYNPRKDLQPGDAEYEKLRASIEQFGYVAPAIFNKQTSRLVGGHQQITDTFTQALQQLAARSKTSIDVDALVRDRFETSDLEAKETALSGQVDAAATAIDELIALDRASHSTKTNTRRASTRSRANTPGCWPTTS